ncbi:uncharacterized protein LOC113855520 [Abrus precatorius]|uniref:Uncharacterized protein LOC113855520 n=1 Tax=Abrus precatorius TaxID=3816 RepID=A0A8B8KGL8_ABRPR|nr:uncharacterized protein LOC113855520 [Abrus precatorius]
MEKREVHLYFNFIAAACAFLLFPVYATLNDEDYISAIGDSGMRRDGLRVAIESWNQCNEVGKEAPNMGSPRMADCFDLIFCEQNVDLVHRVHEWQNRLGISSNSSIPLSSLSTNKYAAMKELYLGAICEVLDTPRPWQFWMIMLKSGNMDTLAAVCPNNGFKAKPFPQSPDFPCFGKGCMNMPSMYHKHTKVYGDERKIMKGSFYGSWDLNVDTATAANVNDTSYYSVTWEKEVGNGSWVFHNVLKTSSKYPWLMLYLRSDATAGFSGGYHYETRGMSKIVPKSPHFKVTFTLDIKKGGGPKSQFYLMDIGSCWKNNGKPCNGDVTSDVTRYSEMIINPEIEPWCKPDQLQHCPPHHIFANGTQVYRTDAANFPYDAYHVYRAPGNAMFLEKPVKTSDPYSNPQPQEILQILPHPVWGEYGYPTKKGEGWVGDSRTWELDVGRLSQSIYFYQDPGTKPVERYWSSITLGTEIYISGVGHLAEWTVSNFDIIIPKHAY